MWVGCVACICEMRNADNILTTKHGGLRQRHKLDCSVRTEVGKEQCVTMWTEFTWLGGGVVHWWAVEIQC